jgi:hypothetical protein
MSSSSNDAEATCTPPSTTVDASAFVETPKPLPVKQRKLVSSEAMLENYVSSNSKRRRRNKQ